MNYEIVKKLNKKVVASIGVFFLLIGQSSANEPLPLDTLLASSDTIVMGKVMTSSLGTVLEKSGLPQIDYIVKVDKFLTKSGQYSLDKLRHPEVHFSIEISKNLVPTGARGIFFLKRHGSKYVGVLGDYSLFLLDSSTEVNGYGYPIENKFFTKMIGFDKKIRFTIEQTHKLYEDVKVLSGSDLGTVSQAAVIKASKLLEYAQTGMANSKYIEIHQE